jgi:omega-amidase
MSEIKIGLLQVNETRITAALPVIESALKSESDLLILPEKWVPVKEENIIRDDRHEFLDDISSLSKDYSSVVLTGGLYESFAGEMFITCYAFGPDGEMLAKQRKLHLFEAEAQSFKPGYEVNYFDYRNSRIGIAICYDIDFPETVRKFALSDCDVLAVPAKIWKEGMEPWMIYVQARVLENRMPIAFANFKDGEYFGGGSALVELERRKDRKIVYAKTRTVGESENLGVFKLDTSQFRTERQKRLSDRNRTVDAFAWEEG